MKRINSIVLFLIAACMMAMAQTPDTTITREQHLQDYDFAVKYIEDNYAGYFDKVTDSRLAEYNDMKATLRQQVENAERPCWDAIAAYTGWFNDLHLVLCVSYGKTRSVTYHPKAQQRINYVSQMEEYAPKPVACKATDKTFLIRFPSCSGNPDAKWVKKSIKLFKKSHCENLIIDLRGNNGGDDGYFAPYQKLLYDHEVADTDEIYRVTPQNMAYLKQVGWWQGKILEKLIAEQPDKEFLPVGYRVLKYNVDRSLRRAALIIDNRVGSSGEGCVLKAKVCSNRTTVYGRDNTAGCIDYGNIYYITVPNCKLYLQLPMSHRYHVIENPIDPTGIAPDVRINLPLPRKLTDNVDEWVIWVAEQLEKE
ncbi:MAG: peptidase S41 [Muribaculaceae bacterium]|nr:peptidase S41 [Muribaculaceae bacterium]